MPIIYETRFEPELIIRRDQKILVMDLKIIASFAVLTIVDVNKLTIYELRLDNVSKVLFSD